MMQAAEGSLWEFSSSLIQRIGGFIFIIIIARILLPEGFGLYNLVLSIALIFMLFSFNGINETFIRFLSETINKSEKRSRAFFRYIFKLKIIMVLVVSITLVIFAYPISFYLFHKPQLFIPLLLASVYIFVLSLEGFFSSLFFILKKVKYVTIKGSIYQVLRILIVVIIFFLILENPSVSYTITALIIATLATFSFVLYKDYKLTPFLFKGDGTVSKPHKKRILRFFMYMTLGSLSFIFLGNIDTIMIGLFVQGTKDIGIYRSAFALVASATGLFAFGYVLVPIFVQIKKQNLERAFNKVFRYLMMLSIPAAFGLASLANYFIVLFYGYEYVQAIQPLYVLSALLVLGLQVGLFSDLFATKERPKDYLPILIAVIFINIILNYTLIKIFLAHSPKLIVTGVAVATITSWFIYNLSLYYLVRKKLKIKPDLTTMIKPIISSIVMLVVILWLKKILGDISIIKGILLVIFGIATYSISLFIIKGITNEDFDLVKYVLRRKN